MSTGDGSRMIGVVGGRSTSRRDWEKKVWIRRFSVMLVISKIGIGYHICEEKTVLFKGVSSDS